MAHALTVRERAGNRERIQLRRVLKEYFGGVIRWQYEYGRHHNMMLPSNEDFKKSWARFQVLCEITETIQRACGKAIRQGATLWIYILRRSPVNNIGTKRHTFCKSRKREFTQRTILKCAQMIHSLIRVSVSMWNSPSIYLSANIPKLVMENDSHTSQVTYISELQPLPAILQPHSNTQ